AEFSTGPRTLRGKSISRLNALRHGLTARQVLLFDENAEDFEGFAGEIIATLKPRNPVESQLAERVAICGWRLRRCYRIEAAMFENVRRNWGNGAATVMTRIEHLFIRVSAHDDHLAKLTRYETSIERSMLAALFALRQLRTP
ncbi:MAG: hypothetical protein ACREFO_08440, partial [Acetobacteraceae bacterium]